MVREKAAEVVSNVFYGTLMKEFRASTEDSMFSGGFAGQAFQQQLDNMYVSEISKQVNNPIVDAMVRQLGGRGSNAVSSISAMTQAGNQANGQAEAISAMRSTVGMISQ